jgi:Methyltransferase domain
MAEGRSIISARGAAEEPPASEVAVFEIIKSNEIMHRHELAHLCNNRGIKQAVEVGVEYGHFAYDFLREWSGDTLLLVDDYASHPEHPGNRLPDIVTVALTMVMNYRGRYRFFGLPSIEAAAQLPVWFKPGFVYIDASHDFDSAIADMRAWWPKIEPGGILAGHDYDPTHPCVMSAVQIFGREKDVLIRLTHEPLASWYIYKE